LQSGSRKNLAQKEIDMDFIERLFGISPDGGSGLFELLLFIIPIIGLAALWRALSSRADRRMHDKSF